MGRDDGSAEVVALIARLSAEGKLTSSVSGGTMKLRLNADRDTLDRHERTLVDGLFFNNRTTTNKELVAEHYKDTGYNPASAIAPELKARVDEALPPGRPPARFGFVFHLLWLAAVALLVREHFVDGVDAAPAFIAAGIFFVLLIVGTAVGTTFRANIHWRRRAALACLIPGFLAVGGTAVFLWNYVRPTGIDASATFAYAVAAFALAVLGASLETMKTRQHRAAVAFRKRLAAARLYFTRELEKPAPALRDEWTPWMLAFGLGNDIDRWSVRRADRDDRSASFSGADSVSTSASSSVPASFTGFGGGRSGGAGASGSWAAAAGGLAAGVSPPSSSGSDGGSSSSGGSSSGGSSGGGGGGGW
jgi:uncharacterized membrane protein YgcG